MTTGLNKYDDWLNELVDSCALDAGEDVSTYVARAVATRLIADLNRSHARPLHEVMAHLAASGVLPESGLPLVSVAIADPGRLRALRATGLLDSPAEESYDRITRAAAHALNTPYAAMSLVDIDRQFFKSTVGMGSGPLQKRQTPLDRSLCQYVVANGAPMLLGDARTDPVFRNHPAVADGTVTAYLGVPLQDDDHNSIGTLCVFDDKPRLWTTGHVQILSDMAHLVAERIFGDRAATRY